MLGMQLLFVAAIASTTGCSSSRPVLLTKPHPFVLDTMYGRARDPANPHAPMFYCSPRGPFSCPQPTPKTAYVPPPRPAFDPSAYIKAAAATLTPAVPAAPKPPIVFGNVLFGFDEFSLTQDAKKQLVTSIPSLKGKKVELQGYTDSVGSDDYNFTLAAKRANAVRDFLVSSGLEPAAIQPAAKGDCCFVASNDSDDGRQQNRRVEIHLLP